MSSNQIVFYLTLLAINQRKITYCRQILAANSNFIPLQLFKRSAKSSNCQLKRNQLYQMLEDIGTSFCEEEKDLIFNYFRIDDKQYISYDQFYAQIIPKNDQSLQKIVENRKKDNFELDYSLRYALNKYFIQACQSQLDLELKINFQIQPSEKIDSKCFKSRISAELIEHFMNLHSKYPTKNEIECILKEVNQNKGPNRRNALIRDYIVRHLNKIKLNKGQLPKIIPYATSLQIKSRKRDSIPKQKGKENSPYKKLGNISNNSMNSSMQSIINKSLPPQTLGDVENKIKNLLNAIYTKPASAIFKENKQTMLVQKQKIIQNSSPQKIIQKPQEIVAKKQINKHQKEDQIISLERNHKNSIQRERLRKRFNLQEQPSERSYKSAKKYQSQQKLMKTPQTIAKNLYRQSSQERTIKQESQALEDQLSYRYRRYNYLRQEKRQFSRKIDPFKWQNGPPQKINPPSKRR